MCSGLLDDSCILYARMWAAPPKCYILIGLISQTINASVLNETTKLKVVVTCPVYCAVVHTHDLANSITQGCSGLYIRNLI